MPKCCPVGLSKLMEGGLMPVEVDFLEELSRRVVRQEKKGTAEWQPLGSLRCNALIFRFEPTRYLKFPLETR